MTVPHKIYVIEDRRAVFRCQTMPMTSVIKRSTPNDNMWEFMGAFVHPSFSSGMPGSPQTQKPRRRPGEAIAPLDIRRNMTKYITERTSHKSQKGLYTMTEMKLVSSFDYFAPHTHQSTKVKLDRRSRYGHRHDEGEKRPFSLKGQDGAMLVACGGSLSPPLNLLLVQGERFTYVGTLQRHYRKIPTLGEEIYDVGIYPPPGELSPKLRISIFSSWWLFLVRSPQSYQRGTTTAMSMPRPSSDAEEEPAYLRNDPGLACLASQLRRINAQIMRLERLKERVADAEERCMEDLTTAATSSSGGSIDSSSSSKDEAPGRNATTTTTSSSDQDAKGRWAKHYDTEVQAEYWYNDVTGEASWLDPRYGSMDV